MLLDDKTLITTLYQLIDRFEFETVEFKKAENGFDTNEIGEYFSAISNEAALKGKQFGWLVFGVTNDKQINGSHYRESGKHTLDGLKKEIGDGTTGRITFIEIYTVKVLVDGKERRVVMFQIPACVSGIPTAWKNICYAREGESLVPLSLQKSDQIRAYGTHDWSRQVCDGAAINNLDPQAIKAACEKFKQKYDNKFVTEEIDGLSDIDFLNKAKLTIDGKITHTSLLLLGKSESDHFFNFSPQITWILYGSDGEKKDYEHFPIPFLLAVDKVYSKIRNLRYRYMAGQMSLFPLEVDQYDAELIREVLHNCIAHQNYFIQGRIYVHEYEDKLIFTNEGEFIPGSIENPLRDGYQPPYYRNNHLANAMVNLKMIDTIGMGIKKIFTIQKNKFFPLPDYDLSEQHRVKVTIYGKILDQNYTKLLYNETTLNIETVFMLDRVQKKLPISRESAVVLKKHNLIEGRFPNIFLSSQIAEITGDRSEYIATRGLDDAHYKKLIIEYIKKFKSVSREQINEFLLDKLPEILTYEQKMNKIRNYLYGLKAKGYITTNGLKTNQARWIYVKKEQ
jgi:ATP-dependent DNA helicase RecG